MRPAAGTEPRTAAPRRTRDSATTAASILTAATREFSTHGFGGGRVDRIAARAGVNKRMIYHYYGDKRGLYLAVLEHAYEKERSAEQKLALDALEPEEAMRRLVEYTFDSFVKDRSFIKLLNDENLHKGAHLKRSRQIAEMHSPLIAIVQGILERGAETGVFRRDADPMQTWISIAAVSYFYFSNLYTLSTIFRRDFDAPAERTARRRHVVDLILSSLRPLTREKAAR